METKTTSQSEPISAENHSEYYLEMSEKDKGRVDGIMHHLKGLSLQEVRILLRVVNREIDMLATLSH